MKPAHRRRNLAASAFSLALHVVVLAAMVLGLRVASPPPEDRSVEVTLIPALPPDRASPQPRLSQAPRQLPPAPAPRPRLAQPTPQAPPPIPAPPAPPAPEPRPPAAVQGPLINPGSKGMAPTLTGRLGCDDPASFHLTDAQQAVCAERLARVAKGAKPLALNIAPEMQAAADRNRRCHDAYARSGVPGSAAPSQVGYTGAGLPPNQPPGLGLVPSAKDCGVGDR